MTGSLLFILEGNHMSARKNEHNRILALEEENFHLSERVHRLELENERLKRQLERRKDTPDDVLTKLKRLFA